MPVRSWFIDEPMHFWRPLYCYVYTPIVAALYQSPRVMHVLAACCHMGVSLALWGLMRSLGAGCTPAAIAGLAFLVYPAHFEGAFWIPCTPTPLATALVLAAVWMQARWVRHLDGVSRASSVYMLLLAAAPAALAFAAASLNEQPAFLAAVMPLAIMCERAGRSREAGKPARARWWIAIIPTLAACGAVMVYMLIANALHPRRVKPGTGGLITVEELIHRAQEFGSDVIDRHMLRDFAGGAWSEGWKAIGERPVFSALIGGLIILTGIVWVCQGRFDEQGASSSSLKTNSRGPALILLGVGMFLAGWVPLVLIHYPASPRLAYAPSAGLAIALAGLLEAMLCRKARLPAARIVARAAALPALICAAVMMVGIQHAYRVRWQADEQQGEALRQLVPTPPSAPRTVFIPVRVADRPVQTGATAFDRYFISPLFSEWAAGWWLQLHYRREDVSCVLCPPGTIPALGWVDARQIQTAVRVVHPGKPRNKRFAIRQIVPFEVNEAGEVLLYTHVVFQGAEGAGSPVPLPLAAAAFEQGRLPKRVLELSKAPEEDARSSADPKGQ